MAGVDGDGWITDLLQSSSHWDYSGIIRISQGMSRNEFHNWEERRKYAKIVEHNGTQIVEHM